MLAYDYPLLGIFLTTLWFFLFVIWIMLLLHVIGDIFRSSDLGGAAKVLWLIFVIVLPYLGVFAYLMIRGGTMAERRMAEAKAHDDAVRAYVRETAGTQPDPAAQIEQLAALRDRGVLSDDEFAAGKAKALS
jgi:Phospholipase_D-nuclease N-terminal/Short C-terminal domain